MENKLKMIKKIFTYEGEKKYKEEKRESKEEKKERARRLKEKSKREG